MDDGLHAKLGAALKRVAHVFTKRKDKSLAHYVIDDIVLGLASRHRPPRTDLVDIQNRKKKKEKKEGKRERERERERERATDISRQANRTKVQYLSMA